MDSSLVNLLSYPYVRAAVAERDLKLVGGYYNFVHGTFELWELDVDIDIVCVNINKWQKIRQGRYNTCSLCWFPLIVCSQN